MTINDLLQELEEEAQTTRRVLARVREDQLGWAPHEKSMTLGQLAMHVASVPGAIAGISTQPTFEVKTPIPRPSATSVAELLKRLDESVARAKAILREMGDAALLSPWRMVDGDQEVAVISRGALLRSIMLNHWYHHRGQLTVYLRQTGSLVPAIYGASADENPFTK
ncbi:MAG: DinB family protein [candidate division KSB1 bacterium]|nr:DinB family protein [candidate division KSB1 bacterium]